MERRRRNRGMRRSRQLNHNDYRRDYRSDYRNDYNNDYRSDYDYKDYRDYNDYDYADDDFKQDLDRLIRKLSRRDRYKMSMQQVIDLAKKEGARFEEVTEEEFYVIYLAMLTDYEDISTDPSMFVKMAIDFIEDDDIAVSPSEKVNIYINDIILGK